MERLDAVKARLDTVDQLELVITAMRSIAAARASEARARLAGVTAYAGTIGRAIGEALALLPEAPPTVAGTVIPSNIVIALTAEQGFAGAFSARVLDCALAHLETRSAASDTVGEAELMVVGDRGLLTAAERSLPVVLSLPMAAHADEIPALASRIADTMFARFTAGKAVRVTLIHAEPDASATARVTERTLLPFDYGRFPSRWRTVAPLALLPPERLAAKLADEYVFAELCAALLLSFVAENEARRRAMISARNNVRRTRESLHAEFRRLRQEQITTEAIELSAGRLASGQAVSASSV